MNNTSQAAYIGPPPRAESERKTIPLALLLSLTLHIGAVVAIVFWQGMAPPPRPPQYRVELIGAAGLKKQMGIVAEQTPVTETAPAPAEAPKAAERAPERPKVAPIKKVPPKLAPKPAKATPNQTPATKAATDAPKAGAKAAVPVAGSGQTKGRGTDITNMLVEGIAFPYPGYLENISRQIILLFSWEGARNLMAEVRFVIHRDGSVTDIVVLKGSGNTSFDREARGSIEAVGNKRGFGPLPAGYSDDVLPVYFTFRPQV